MLHAAPVHFVSKVGVAPSTTTMMIPADRSAHPAPAVRRKPAAHAGHGYRVPYGTIEDLRSSNGLGIVNESDAWLTGRPYGLPGTASVKFVNGPTGMASMMVGGGFGHAPATHDRPYIVGGFGDASAATASEIALQQIATAQAAQQESMSRMAFWASIAGATAVAASVTTILVAIISGAAEANR